MHFVWANEPTSEKEASMIYGVAEVIEKLDLNFEQGFRVEADVPLIVIARDEDSQGILPDNIVGPGTGGLLFSSRLRKVLSAVGVNNIDYYPCRIENPLDGTVSDDYMIANIIGRITCMDRDASEFETYFNMPEKVQFIDKLVLNEKALDMQFMFRMDEFSQIIIVHEKVKKACEKAKITGVVFYEPEDYTL